MSRRSNRKFWDRYFSARRLYNFISSATVGKGGRRKDASLPEAAMAKVNAVRHTHTKVGERMIDLPPQQENNSDGKRQNKNVLNNMTLTLSGVTLKKNAVILFDDPFSILADN